MLNLVVWPYRFASPQPPSDVIPFWPHKSPVAPRGGAALRHRLWRTCPKNLALPSSLCPVLVSNHRGNIKPASFPSIFQSTDRKSTRLNSSHSQISYAVFCLK